MRHQSGAKPKKHTKLEITGIREKTNETHIEQRGRLDQMETIVGAVEKQQIRRVSILDDDVAVVAIDKRHGQILDDDRVANLDVAARVIIEE